MYFFFTKWSTHILFHEWQKVLFLKQTQANCCPTTTLTWNEFTWTSLLLLKWILWDTWSCIGQSGSRGPALWDWVCVHRSLAGVSPSLCHLHKSLMNCGRPATPASAHTEALTSQLHCLTEMQKKVPGGTREPSVTKSQQPRIKPLHSVNFLNGAHGHSRGVLAKQFLQLESGDSTQCDSQLSASHCHTGSLAWRYRTRCQFSGLLFLTYGISKCRRLHVYHTFQYLACQRTSTNVFVQENMQSCSSGAGVPTLLRHVSYF